MRGYLFKNTETKKNALKKKKKNFILFSQIKNEILIAFYHLSSLQFLFHSKFFPSLEIEHQIKFYLYLPLNTNNYWFYIRAHCLMLYFQHLNNSCFVHENSDTM